jgi:hypothetical protein
MPGGQFRPVAPFSTLAFSDVKDPNHG